MSSLVMDGSKILGLARAALEKHFAITEHDLSAWFDESLATCTGAFVSLYNQGDLRGCIGHLESENPLYAEIPYLSKMAATSDHRFKPVVSEELKDIIIEVSVLTLPELLVGKTAMDKVNQLIPHVHGVILAQGNNKATFLPQVWDSLNQAEDFLTQLSLKAGLHSTAWMEDSTVFHVYKVDIFKEV